MKSCILSVCVILVTFCSYAQTVAIENEKLNVLYVGKDNLLTIVAAGYSCDSLIVTINNGTIIGTSGHYIARPDHPDPNTTITIQAKTSKGLKDLDKKSMRVKLPFSTKK